LIPEKRHTTRIPPKQQAIRDQCFHPTGTFIVFREEEIEQSIPDRFEQQVRKYPDRLAVVDGNSSLTYGELNRQANRVAHAVLALSGAENEPVALLFEPSLSIYPAVLGALKAGKSYVPLDASLPESRNSYILENSQSRLLITSTPNCALAQRLALNRSQLLNVDELDSALDTGNPDFPISPDSLAWIIYTSGSTGQPKGVFHNHRNLLHMMMNYTNHFGICPEDRLSLLSSYSVHVGTYGAFMSLVNGATLYPRDTRKLGIAGMADKRLVAYVVPDQESVPTSSELRRFLQGELPNYMIPSAFVMLDSLPLTPNGKIDRAALPAPGRTRPELEAVFVAPRTIVEEVLEGIWVEILGVERVGIHDNFFELGGHSLLATLVIARVIRALQVEVPLRSLFETPTVAGLAAVILQNQAKLFAQEDMERILTETEALSEKEARLLLIESDES